MSTGVCIKHLRMKISTNFPKILFSSHLINTKRISSMFVTLPKFYLSFIVWKDQGSIAPMFYGQLFHALIPKAQKTVISVYLSFLDLRV